MGKYDSVLTNLKPLPAADPSYQEKVDSIKRLVTDRDAFRLAQTYAVLRKGSGQPLTTLETEILIKRIGKDGIKALASTCEVLVKAYEQLLEDSQQQEAKGWGMFGVKDNAIRLPSGETIRIQKEPYGKVVDKEAFRLWCMAPADKCMQCGQSADAMEHDLTPEGIPFENGHKFHPGGGMERQLQLWPSTMNALVKERLMAGEAEPDGTEAFSYTEVQLVKAPEKKDG